MISQVSGATQTTASSSSSASSADSLAQEQVFLKLLVAQVQNQNPMDPNQDPTQYVTQLAQFSALEQLTQIRTDLDTLVGDASQANSTQEAT
jgi:flagellar basal-body rod modification protein FlgD